MDPATAAAADDLSLPREPRAAAWLRRGASLSVLSLALVAALALAPLWIPAAALLDWLRPGRCTLRCGLFLLWYLLCELAGVLAAGWLWVLALPRSFRGAWSERDLERHFRLQNAWAGALMAAAATLFRLRWEVEGSDRVARPMLLLLRHASVADTLIASETVSQPHGVRLRYVLKRELLWDPCLDLVGQRLPNAFVDRGSSDSSKEVQRVQALLQDLGEREGVLIYPEGTRFDRTKRRRILDRLRQQDSPHADRAAALRHTLPPRVGGVLGLLEANPGLDVVIGAHTGLEGATSFWELWNGSLLDARVQVAFWRIPAAEIPRERSARIAWLWDQWERVDRWIAERRPATGGGK